MRVLPHALIASAVTALLVAKDAIAATGSSRSSEMPSGTMIVRVVIGIGVLVVLGVAVEVVRRIRVHQNGNSPEALFYGLCRVHDLDRSARALMWEVACLHRLAHPACVFTEPRWLDPAGLRNSLGPRVAEAAALHARLFDGIEGRDGPQRPDSPTPR